MWHENVELSDCRDKTLKWCQLAMLTSFSDKKKKKKSTSPFQGLGMKMPDQTMELLSDTDCVVKSLRPGSAGSRAAFLFIHASLQLIPHRSRCDRTCIKVFLKIALLFFHTALYGEQRRGGCAEDVLKANQPIWCHLSPLQKQTNKQTKKTPKKRKSFNVEFVLLHCPLIRKCRYSAVT